MHQYYDSRLFDVMDLNDMKRNYAPKENDEGKLLEAGEVELLSAEEKVRLAVDVTSTEHFMAAGFDVNFVGPVDDLRCHLCGEGNAALDTDAENGAGKQDGGDDDGVSVKLSSGVARNEGRGVSGEFHEEGVEDGVGAGGRYVDEETFCIWLDRSEFSYGLRVQKWWSELTTLEEECEDAA